MDAETGDIDRAALDGCRHCRALSYPQDRYCSRCGARLQRHLPGASVDECPACGMERRHPVSFYCTRCGRMLPNAGR